MPGMGSGLGAAALEWEMRKQDEKEKAAREVEQVAMMSNMAAMDKTTPNPTAVDAASLVDAKGEPIKVNAKDGVAVYDEDHMLGKGYYNPYTKRYGNKADRNFNQGNITGMGGKLLYGAERIAYNKFGDKGDQAQQVYPNAKAGWKAMYGLMMKQYTGGSIKQQFKKWQNVKSERGAAAWKQIQTSMVHRGINIDKNFKDLSMEQKMIVMNVRAHHEGWTGAPLNDTSIF